MEEEIIIDTVDTTTEVTETPQFDRQHQKIRQSKSVKKHQKMSHLI